MLPARGVLSLLLVLSPAWFATSAGAAVQPAPRVLLVVDQPDDPFAERIRAELTGLGLVVVALETWRTGEPVTSLEGAARREQAAAAVRMIASRRGVEIWLGDQSTGRPLLRQLVVDERPEGPNQGLVALQTVELLRTSLLPGIPFGTQAMPPSPAPVAPGPPVVTTPSGPPGPSAELGVQLALGTLFSPGGVGAALQAWSTLHRALGERLELALDVSLPVRSATVTGPEGSARVGTYLLGLALVRRGEPPSPHVHVAVALGASVVRVGVDGEAMAPLLSR